MPWRETPLRCTASKTSFPTPRFQNPLGPLLPASVCTRSIASILESRVIDYDAMDPEAEDAFYVADMGEIVRQQARWHKLLPRVEPFYAVKCNPNNMVLKTLASIGTGFDCASKGEIQMALDQGVVPSKIIYANPCKQISHIRFAAAAGVRMMTFDNADELRKVKSAHPNAQMVLRILTDDSRSICKLGTKFGASMSAVPYLLRTAREIDIDVIGISFHVGSGCFDANAFGEAVILARKAFDEGAAHGFNFRLLDVGGGFPGNNAAGNGVGFQEIAAILGPTIDRFFGPEVRVIAEPGRYYVSSAFTLAVNVIARRVVPRDAVKTMTSAASATTVSGPAPTRDDHPSYMYYVNDGMYGSFNCITFDHAVVTPQVLARSGQFMYGQSTLSQDVDFPCSVWGPTCDSIDCIGKNFSLPEMQIGDWLHFDNMGAYTMCAASQFNGFKKSAIIYTNTEA
ncbi:pyridoxal-dependent decarboxylase [Geranomyces variabilis]|nr:pyridoxal-dependent decarboxylase [Geranomyces variabilis]